MTSSSTFSDEEQSFFFHVKSHFHSLLNFHHQQNDDKNINQIYIMNNFLVPAAVFAAKSSSRSKMWIEEQFKPLVADECGKLRNEYTRTDNTNGASSLQQICDAVIEGGLYQRFLKSIEFLSAVTFPFEQSSRTECHFNTTAVIAMNNLQPKSSRRVLPQLSLKEQFKMIFVTNLLFSTVPTANEKQSQVTITNLEVKKFISVAASSIVKKIFGLNLFHETSSNFTLFQHACPAMKSCIDCFGLLSGFRQSLVSKIRRELEKTLPQYSNKIDNNNNNNTNQANANAKNASIIACSIYKKMEAAKLLSRLLFHHDRPLLEFYIPTSNIITTTNCSFRHKFVTYSPIDTVLIKTIKRVSILGSCDSVGDDEVSVVNKAIIDNILRDKESGIDKAIILQFSSDCEKNGNDCQNVPWKMIQVAGEEAIANILARRIQNHLAMTLEKYRIANNNGNHSNNEIVRTWFMPWLQFVLCDHCVEKQQQNNNIRNVNVENTIQSCSHSLCSSNHTLIASAVREGMRAIFQMPRFETLVTRCLIMEIDSELRKNTNNFIYLYRLLQSVTTLPSHYDHDNNNNNTNASLSLLSEKKSWTVYFQHLAFQRILDQGRQQQLHDTAQPDWLDRERKCSQLLQALCDHETQFYPRRYRGMINGFAAGVKISEAHQNLQNNALILIPQHFMPNFDDDLIPNVFKKDLNTTVHISRPLPYVARNNNFANAIQKASSPFTKLFWLPHEGSASASVKTQNNSFPIIVRGTPLQIALLHVVGNNNSDEEMTLEKIHEAVFGLTTTQEPSLFLVESALRALQDAKLISNSSLVYVAPSSTLPSIQLPSPSSIVENILMNSSISTSAAMRSDRRHFIEAIMSQKISQVAEEIAKNNKSRTGRPTTANNNNTNENDDDLTSLAARTRSQSQERANNNNNSINLISPIVVKCQALRLVKRAGKIKFDQWLEATRHLLKYNISSVVFEGVVDKLVEGEFVNKVVAGAVEGSINCQEENVYEYLP